ncbi:PspA/IM30 family protein [Geobacillus sp. FSL W8-0032]|uniref:PspA/IM30 family protein n=1 Tax=Geobacillus icigianus TaxID=1430331 RepID=A0ABU6BIZ6_9BACL|nr:PspA/IM30 family protein [Geobacillus icigianus]MEB3751971.1 hypothetical protein [Geobacillus icigianus]
MKKTRAVVWLVLVALVGVSLLHGLTPHEAMAHGRPEVPFDGVHGGVWHHRQAFDMGPRAGWMLPSLFLWVIPLLLIGVGAVWLAMKRSKRWIGWALVTLGVAALLPKWVLIALALERNEEAVAKLALRDKLLHEKKREAYKQQYDAIKAKTAEVARRLQELRERYDELAAKQLELTARVNAAQALKQIDTALTSFSADEALRGFARMEERVIALEAEAAAARFGANTALSPVPFEEEVERELAKWKEAQATNA